MILPSPVLLVGAPSGDTFDGAASDGRGLSEVTMPRWPLTVEERFLAKVNKDGPVHPTLGTPCWLWIGTTNGDGYGMFKILGRRVFAHRFSYEQSNGRMPSDLQSDHLCRVRRCVNPDHIEAVTLRENVLRSRNPAANNARKVQCVRGHILAGRNLRIAHKRDGSVERLCRLCIRDRKMAVRLIARLARARMDTGGIAS